MRQRLVNETLTSTLKVELGNKRNEEKLVDQARPVVDLKIFQKLEMIPKSLVSILLPNRWIHSKPACLIETGSIEKIMNSRVLTSSRLTRNKQPNFSGSKQTAPRPCSRRLILSTEAYMSDAQTQSSTTPTTYIGVSPASPPPPPSPPPTYNVTVRINK